MIKCHGWPNHFWFTNLTFWQFYQQFHGKIYILKHYCLQSYSNIFIIYEFISTLPHWKDKLIQKKKKDLCKNILVHIYKWGKAFLLLDLYDVVYIFPINAMLHFILLYLQNNNKIASLNCFMHKLDHAPLKYLQIHSN